MQAIRTVFHGPGKVRGPRVKATASAGSVTLPWYHANNIEDNHRAAAQALVAKFKWNEHREYKGLVGGQLADSSYVWVLDEPLAVRG